MRRVTALFISFSILIYGDDRLRLERADVLENITVQGQAVQILTGNVIFTKGNLTLTCDRAQYQEKSGFGNMVGNIEVTQEDLTLTSDSLTFDSFNDVITGFGQVHIWDKDYDLIADTLRYYTSLDSGLAWGKVRLKQENQTITARQIAYRKKEGRNAVSYVATGNVTIREEDRLATCGTAIYSKDEEMTWLKVNPKITEKDQVLTGSTIELRYQEEKLHSIYIPANAHAVYNRSGWKERSRSQGDSTIVRKIPVKVEDDMTSVALKGYFNEGNLDSLRLEKMATTLYHVFEDSIYKGKNLASGDTVVMQFSDNELNRIYILGGAQGTFTPDSANRNVESAIDYESQLIVYDLKDEMTDLQEQAIIRYGDMRLEAGFINVDWSSNLVTALPEPPADTTLTPIQPTLFERGHEPMEGDELVYNLKTRHGKITHGKTKADDGFYYGNEIRNQDESTFYIQKSRFTTCDLDRPHFHFESNRMKIVNDDKVVAKPIVLYLQGIPVMGLPFGIFPHRSGGRHSGWIMPGYGQSRSRGQFINGLGYYWAPSDYWDSKLTMSFGDEEGFIFVLQNNYKVRYRFQGGLRLETWQRLAGGENNIMNITKNRQSVYSAKWTHNQVMRNNQTLRVNWSYYSDGRYNYTIGLNQARRLNQQSISQATYTKRWKKSNNSINISLSSNTDLMADKKIDPEPANPFYTPPTKAGLQTKITNYSLPVLSFNHPQNQLFGTTSTKRRWYHNITWSYNSRLTNKMRTYYESDSLNDTTFYWNPDAQRAVDNALTHSLNFNAPEKIFKYITISPNLHISSDWVTKTTEAKLSEEGNLQIKRQSGLAIRTTGSFGINMRTQIYGLFPIKIGPFHYLRHVATPSIGYSYTPDFSKPLFGQDLGYFQSITDTSTGEVILHDRFGGLMVGGTPRQERQLLTFSLNNVFQTKIQRGEKEKKLQLFSWNLSTSYNFVKPVYKLANLSSSIRTKIGQKLHFDLTMTHDFYAFDAALGQRSTSLRRTAQGIPLPRLVSARLGTGFSFSGKRLQAPTTPTAEDTTVNLLADSLLIGRQDEDKPVNPLGSGELWKTTFNFSYSVSKTDPLQSKENFWMNTNTRLQITKNWRVSYNARFDLINKTLVSHQLSLYRDLHCWELAITWTPSGYGSSFYLRINVKSPLLRDLKIEEQRGFRSRVPWL